MEYRTDFPATADKSFWFRHRKVSWGAIFGGAFFGCGIMITLISLGIAVGISSVNPWKTHTVGGMATGELIWWVIAGIIALFFAGWATGLLSGFAKGIYRVLNALVVWGFISTAMFCAMAIATGALLSGGMGLLQAGTSAAGPAAGAAANSGLADTLRNRLGAGPSDSMKGRPAPGSKDTMRNQARPKSQDSMRAQSGQGAQDTGAARPNAGMLDTEKQKAKQTAAQVKKAATGIAWATFIMLLLNGIAAALGGSVGAPPRKDEELVR